MFNNQFDSFVTNKNLPPFWCNAIPNQVAVIEPPFRGHSFFMARGDYNKIPLDSFLNKKYGKLTITKETKARVYPSGGSFRRVEAICECGVIKEYNLMNILHGQSTNCGCERKKVFNHTTHGLSGTPLYRAYNDIKTRCYNSKRDVFPYYGGKGVKMCDEWLNDFMVFYNWAMENGWQKGLTVDRYPNQDGDYEPTNCRIGDMEMQSRNRSSNVKITFNGETKIMVEWAEQYGLDQDLVQSRRKRGWSIKECLTIPAKRLGRKNRIKIK